MANSARKAAQRKLIRERQAKRVIDAKIELHISKTLSEYALTDVQKSLAAMADVSRRATISTEAASRSMFMMGRAMGKTFLSNVFVQATMQFDIKSGFTDHDRNIERARALAAAPNDEVRAQLRRLYRLDTWARNRGLHLQVDVRIVDSLPVFVPEIVETLGVSHP